MDLDGSYSAVCSHCSVRPTSRVPKETTQDVTWARGHCEFVRLTAVQIDRIILIGAIEGSSAELIQEMLSEANEALLCGRKLIL